LHVYEYVLDLDGILVVIQRQGLELDVLVAFLFLGRGYKRDTRGKKVKKKIKFDFGSLSCAFDMND
jgi:hypothetical protein